MRLNDDRRDAGRLPHEVLWQRIGNWQAAVAALQRARQLRVNGRLKQAELAFSEAIERRPFLSP